MEGKGIDSAWKESYWRDGFVILPGVVPLEDIALLSIYFDEMLAQATGLARVTKTGLTEFRVVDVAGKPTLKFVKWGSALHEGLNQIRTSPRLLEIVMALLGPDLRQITNQMHYKNPGDGVSFQMHQDCVFRKPDSDYRDLYHGFLQAAIAVDPSTRENGCLQFIPGSHVSGKSLLDGGYEGWEANAHNAAVLERLPAPVDAIMRPGDVALWNPFTIHGSLPNTSRISRRVYINGFARSDCTHHGVETVRTGKVLPLRYGPETVWDVVEEK